MTKITQEEYEYAQHQIYLYSETVKRYQQQLLDDIKKSDAIAEREYFRSHPELNP